MPGNQEQNESRPKSTTKIRNSITRRRAIAGGAALALLTGVGWLLRPPLIRERQIWSEASPMPVAKGEMKAAVIDDEIYVPGGLVGRGSSTNRLDTFIPETGEWRTNHSRMPEALNHHSVSAVDDELYVFGGNSEITDAAGRGAYRYSPESDEWNEITEMPEGRWGHDAAVVDKEIYIAGGEGGGESPEVLIYNTELDTWRRGSAMPSPREHLAVEAVDDEVISLAGRWNWENKSEVEIYNPESDEWRSAASIPTPRSGVASCVLNDEIHVAGGENPSTLWGGTFDEHEVYDPGPDEWISEERLPVGLHGPASVSFEEDFYVIGGAWRQGLWSITSWLEETFVYSE